VVLVANRKDDQIRTVDDDEGGFEHRSGEVGIGRERFRWEDDVGVGGDVEDGVVEGRSGEETSWREDEERVVGSESD